MTEIIKKSNSPEDIERVNMTRGLVVTNIGVMGNNDSEMSRIEEICNDFENGKLSAADAVKDLTAVWQNKQQGAM
jgi:hypothetical protein